MTLARIFWFVPFVWIDSIVPKVPFPFSPFCLNYDLSQRLGVVISGSEAILQGLRLSSICFGSLLELGLVESVHSVFASERFLGTSRPAGFPARGRNLPFWSFDF